VGLPAFFGRWVRAPRCAGAGSDKGIVGVFTSSSAGSGAHHLWK